MATGEPGRRLLFNDPDDRRRVDIAVDLEKIAPIVSRYGQHTEALYQANAEFTEEELGIVARYLERTGETF